MLERVYEDGRWQNCLPLPASFKRAANQQRYAVETIGGILVANQDGDLAPTGKVKAMFVCGHRAGEVTCSHMITVLDDGSQLRVRRAEAMNTLVDRTLEVSIELTVVNCDVHGGLRFPSTVAVVEELQRRMILDEAL